MKGPRKSETVIQDAIAAIEAGQLIPSKHAILRMKERKISLSDIEEAIYQGVREDNKDSMTEDGSNWKYAIRGKNDIGDKDIRVIVLYLKEPKMLMVTAIDLNQ